MKPKATTLMLLALLFASLLVGLFALAACKPATGQPLTSIHQDGQLEDLAFINDGTCLGCHTQKSVVQSTEKYGGQTDLNIHRPPESMQPNYGNCRSCHKLDEQPELTCNNNACHDFRLPEGWNTD